MCVIYGVRNSKFKMPDSMFEVRRVNENCARIKWNGRELMCSQLECAHIKKENAWPKQFVLRLCFCQIPLAKSANGKRRAREICEVQNAIWACGIQMKMYVWKILAEAIYAKALVAFIP